MRLVGVSGRRAIRVLLFDHTAQLGGGELALAEITKCLDSSRVHVTVLLGSHGPLEEVLPNHIPLYFLPLDPKVVDKRRESIGAAELASVMALYECCRYVLRLSRFLTTHRIEILHANSLKAAILGGLAGRLTGCKVIWHIRDRIAPDYLPPRAVAFMRATAKVLPHFIIGNSRATLQTIVPMNTPSAVVYSGVDLTTFHPDKKLCQDRTSDSVKTVGLVGRLCQWKGQHVFIEAAHRVHEMYPHIRFLLVGSALFGEELYEERLRSMVKDYGLEAVVTFTSFRKDIASVIRSLDVLVHASVIGEPFGQVIVQAMASGTPVVATNGGGVPEIVLDSVTGCLVPMGDPAAMADAIIKLLTDPATAERLSGAARHRIKEHFTIQQSTERVTSIYEQLCDR